MVARPIAFRDRSFLHDPEQHPPYSRPGDQRRIQWIPCLHEAIAREMAANSRDNKLGVIAYVTETVMTCRREERKSGARQISVRLCGHEAENEVLFVYSG